MQLSKYLNQFGALRLALLACVLALTILVPTPGIEAARSGWEMLPTLIAPAMTPLVFMLLMFDIMMCRIRMAETNETVRKKFRFISYVELAAALLLFAIWLPFFLAIGR